MIPRLGAAYWRVWTASTISELGTGLTNVAMPLLAVSYTRDPRLVSLVAAAAFLPVVLIGLQTGVVVDRADRRRVLWQTDLARTALMAVLAVLALTGHGSIWLLCLLALMLGAGSILFANAASAITPMLVGGPELPKANSWLLSAQVVAGQFVGLPLGAALYAVSAGLPFAVDAVSFAVSVLLVARLPGHFRADRTHAEPTTLRQDVREGLGWLWHAPVLRLLAALLALSNLAWGVAESVLVLLALDRLHVGQFGYSLLLLTFGVGALVGSAITPALQRRVGTAGLIRVSALLTSAGLLVPGVTLSVVPIGIGFAVAGAGAMMWDITTITLRQDLVPARLLGRVIAAYRLVGVGTIPFGVVLGGQLAHLFGLQVPYLAAGALAGVILVVSLLRLPGARVTAALAEPVH